MLLDIIDAISGKTYPFPPQSQYVPQIAPIISSTFLIFLPDLIFLNIEHFFDFFARFNFPQIATIAKGTFLLF